MTYTSDDIVKSIKRGITEPNFQSLMTDEDLLQLVDEESLSYIVPILMSLRFEFLITVEQKSIVNSQDEYDIPYRALGRVLRDVYFVMNDSRSRLFYVQPEDIHIYANNGTSGIPKGFCFRGDKVKIVPTSSDTGAFLEFSYHTRPSKLCLTSAAGKITAINGLAVTLDKLPSGVTLIGDLCDIIQGKQGCSLLAYDQAVTNVSGTTLTFASLPTGLVKGDWIAAPERSPVLQIPEEGMQVLAQSTQCRVLEAIGDTEGYQISKSRLEEKVRHFKDLLTPRVEGAVNKVTNTAGLLRTARRNYF